MSEIGIGIIGGGYMGKAHAVAMASVAAVFDTPLRPRLEMIAASSLASAERYRASFGFNRAASDWQTLVTDPKVDAVVIASPQDTHRAIAEAAIALGKPVLCEKPLADTLEDSRAMVQAAEAAGVPNMIGFNYIRTPASQFVRQLLAEGTIGDVTWFRCEHTEDFLSDPSTPVQLALHGPRQWQYGRSCPASHQRRACVDGASGQGLARISKPCTAPAPAAPSTMMTTRRSWCASPQA